MTLTIKKSQLEGVPEAAFAQAVADHARELRWHQEHHADPTRHRYPPPAASALIDAAVRRPDLVGDYVVEDDLTPTLAQKKSDLIRSLTDAEIAAMEAVRPQGKRRLDAIRFQEAMTKITTDSDGVHDLRTEDDKQFCREHEDRLRQFAEIERHFAQAHHDVEDLTAETVDAWKAPTFEG